MPYFGSLTSFEARTRVGWLGLNIDTSDHRAGINRNIRRLGFGAGFRALGGSMINPFVSLYLRNLLQLPYTEIGILLAFINIVPLAVYPFGGMVADRVGRRKIFLSCLGIEAASVFFVGLSMMLIWLPGIVLGGVIDGVAGGALAGPAISAYTADFAKGSDRTKAYTWLRIGVNVGFTVGVVLGSSLIGFIGFPEVGFLSATIMGTGALLLFFSLSPSPYDLTRAHSDQLSSDGKERFSGPGSVGDSIRILAKDKLFLIFCFAMLLTGLTVGQWGTTLPLYVNTVLGVPYGVLGIALSLNGLIVIFGQNATTKQMLGRKHTTSVIYGTLLYVAAFLGLGLLGLNKVDVFVAVCALVVILTFGENLNAITSMTLPSNLAPGSELGSYNGAFSMMWGIGNSIAPVLGGFALGATSNTLVMWLLLVIPAIPAISLFLWLGSRLPQSANRI
jgi:MFS family permease